jgi:hypothetical protein
MASYGDNFDRADSTTVTGWSELTDDWSIKSNQLAPGLATTGLIMYNSPLDTADHYAEITMSVATASSMGVVARSDASGNSFYLLRNNGTSWNIFSSVSGTFISIAAATGAPVNGDIARIQCVGSTIKGFINGVERMSVVDTAVTTGTYGGVRSTQSSTARYDNFLAADVSASTPDNGAFFDFL